MRKPHFYKERGVWYMRVIWWLASDGKPMITLASGSSSAEAYSNYHNPAARRAGAWF